MTATVGFQTLSTSSCSSSCSLSAETTTHNKTKQKRTLADIEDAFYGIFANFPSKTLSLAMRGVAFPTGRCYQPPSDTLSQEVSQLISTDTQVGGAAQSVFRVSSFSILWPSYLLVLICMYVIVKEALLSPPADVDRWGGSVFRVSSAFHPLAVV